MTSLLDSDRLLERLQFEERCNIGRYIIMARIKGNHLHPATGFGRSSNNLGSLIERCQGMIALSANDPHAHTDYVVCDKEDEFRIVWPEDKNIHLND